MAGKRLGPLGRWGWQKIRAFLPEEGVEGACGWDSTSPAPWRHPSLDPAKGAAEDACRVLFTSSVCLVPRQAGQVGARVVLGEESGRRPGLQDSKAVSPEGPLLRRYEGLPLSVGLGNWNLRL